jgi:tetratricopeptide (TPR) repeat protein
MTAGRYYMNTDPYLLFSSVLEREPNNRDALNYLINIAYTRGLYTDALTWVNYGLKHNGSDHDLLVKKMSILESEKNYGAASMIAEKVYRESPNQDNKEHFLELRTLSAKQYINDLEFDSASVALKSVLFYDHSNMAAIDYLVSAYSQQKRYDDALHVIDEALTYYPGNQELLFKKSALLESYQKYADAALISKQLLQKYPDSRQYLVSFIEQSLEAGRQSMQYDD